MTQRSSETAVRVLNKRRAKRVGFGAGDDDDLQRRIRVHANFAEYVPFAVLLLTVAELIGCAGLVLHGLCTTLLVGRLVHAVGLSRPSTDPFGRVVGMSGTLTAILGAAVAIGWRMI